MKTTNKKSDNRSYSPFSYSGSPVPPKGLRPDHNRKAGQIESVGERSFLLGFKPKDQIGAQKNIIPGSYIRTLRKNDGSSQNKTVIYDRSRNSSYEEIIANTSVHDVPSSKNVSYYDENVESSSSIRNVNSNGAPEKLQEKGYKHNANFSTMGSNIENHVADTSPLIVKYYFLSLINSHRRKISFQLKEMEKLFPLTLSLADKTRIVLGLLPKASISRKWNQHTFQ